MQPATPNKARKRIITATVDTYQPSGVEHGRAKRRQTSSPFISQSACSVCLETGLQLVQLGACGHGICRGCMSSALLHAFKVQQLPLRCPLPHCTTRLQLQPCVQLLEQQIPGSGALAAKVLLAAAADLALIPDHLCCHCPYPDCQVPLELPVDDLPGIPLDCPSCQRAVCSTCRSRWHSGLTCAQYQKLLGSKSSHSSRSINSQQGERQQQQRVPLGPTAVPRQSRPLFGAAADISRPRWSQPQQQQQQQQSCQYQEVIVAASTHHWGAGGDTVMVQQQQQQQQQQRGPCDGDSMSWSPAKGAAQ